MTKLTIFLFTCLFLLSATPSHLHASAVVAQEEMRIGLAEKMRSDSKNFPKMTGKKTEKRLSSFLKKMKRKAEKKMPAKMSLFVHLPYFRGRNIH